jgi:DNA replication protein DnaC
MSLKQELTTSIHAGWGVIVIRSYEHDKVLDTIKEIANDTQHRYPLWTWSPLGGTQTAHGAPTSTATPAQPLEVSIEALAAWLQTDQHRSKQTNGPVYAILVADNALAAIAPGGFVQPRPLQSVQNFVERSGPSAGVLIFLAYDNTVIPPELEKLVKVIEHSLPDRDEIQSTINTLLEGSEVNRPTAEEMSLIVDACTGLSHVEIVGALATSLSAYRRLDSAFVYDQKRDMIDKSGFLRVLSTDASFDSIGGLSSLKDFMLRSLKSRSKYARPRGVLLLGVPGVAKSESAKALGNELGIPTLLLDIGALMGGIVGQTEANTRRAIKIIDRIGPCVVIIDEIEKAMSGSSAGAGDSGVGRRMFGQLLTWLNDRESRAYVVATCNDVESLPPELTRAGRFDGTFFIDLPSREQKQTIWEIHRKAFDIDEDSETPDDDLWTGAEIRQACLVASMLECSLLEAARYVMPIAKTAAEKITKLRTWAKDRCLSSESPGVYVGDDIVATSNKLHGNRAVRGATTRG